jgi:hypothetical protein
MDERSPPFGGLWGTVLIILDSCSEAFSHTQNTPKTHTKDPNENELWVICVQTNHKTSKVHVFENSPAYVPAI